MYFLQCIQFLLLCASLLLLMPGGQLAAQEIRSNARGEKIIVYPNGSWRYFNEEKIREAGTYPVIDGKVTSMDNPVPLNEDIARKIASRRTQLAEQATRIAQQRAEEAARQRSMIERQIARHSNNDSKRSLQLRLEAARQTEYEAKKEADMARSELAQMRQMQQKGDILQAFKLDLKDRASSPDLPDASSLSPDFFSAFDPSSYYQYGIATENNLLINPPEEECRYAFDGIDGRTGRKRRQLQQELLFTHTDERLRMYMKEKDYLRCEGYLSAIDGGYRYLTLEFTFAYPNAREAYGFIEKNSILTIKLLNGDFVRLQSGQMDRGSYDTTREELHYTVRYPIDQSLLSFLRDSEVESVRVFWSSGFEEYEVFELDFFIHQIACLERD